MLFLDSFADYVKRDEVFPEAARVFCCKGRRKAVQKEAREGLAFPVATHRRWLCSSGDLRRESRYATEMRGLPGHSAPTARTPSLLISSSGTSLIGRFEFLLLRL